MDGVLGGDTFAVSGIQEGGGVSGYPKDTWKSFDGSNSSYSNWNNVVASTGYITFYNPLPLKVSKLVMLQDTTAPTNIRLLGSNDMSYWESIPVIAPASAKEMIIAVNSTKAFKYHKLVFGFNTGSGYNYLFDLGITAVEQYSPDPLESTWASPAESRYIIKAWNAR